MVLRVIHSVVVHVADVETPIIIHDFGGGVGNGNSNNDDEPNTLYHWNKKVIPNTRLYLLSLDFITPELSQTELNRFFWLISNDPKSGEEPLFYPRSGW